MNGDKGKKGGYVLRSNFERESETEAEASETPKQDGGRRETETLDSIRTAVSEVMTTGMAALQAELKKTSLTSARASGKILKNKWTNLYQK